MWSAQIIDPKRRIIELVWAGKIQPDEVPQANAQLVELIDQFKGAPFDVLVDMSKFISFPPATQHLIAEQQRLVIEKGMRRSAVVVPSDVVKSGLQMIASKSGHGTEYHFATREEALAFLQSDSDS